MMKDAASREKERKAKVDEYRKERETEDSTVGSSTGKGDSFLKSMLQNAVHQHSIESSVRQKAFTNQSSRNSTFT